MSDVNYSNARYQLCDLRTLAVKSLYQDVIDGGLYLNELADWWFVFLRR